MTEYLVDLASYQEGIDLQKVWNAGVRWLNIKTSEGLTYRWRRSLEYARAGKAIGFRIGTFHWLKAGNGRQQAEMAFELMKAHGGEIHQCDCEDNADWPTLRDYVTRFQQLLGRPIIVYTGDWWAESRRWNVAQLTPFLWAAPNAGYLNSYPGDSSPHWNANYWGYSSYAALQYSVSPIAGAGGGNLSKSAFRDPNVISLMTGKGAMPDVPQRIIDALDAYVASPYNSAGDTRINSGSWVALAIEKPIGEMRADVDSLARDVSGIRELLTAGGGNPDTTAVVVAVRELAAELADLRTKLARAYGEDT